MTRIKQYAITEQNIGGRQLNRINWQILIDLFPIAARIGLP